MKKTELKELRTLNLKELETRLASLKKKWLETQVKISVGEEKNIKAARNLRRDIAQILGIITQKKKESKNPKNK